MVTVQQIDDKRISLRCHYAYRGRCRDLPGAEFDSDRKVWVVPIEYLPSVQAAFWGELYYKTPLWKLEGRTEPPKERISYLGPEPEVPVLTLKPYRYQEEGIKFMIDRLNNVGFCLNGDGVGLGKTLESIGVIKWYVEHRGARKILIVCKKSIKSQWAGEIAKIAGWDGEDEEAMPIFVTGDTKAKRAKAYQGIRDVPYGVLVTNYHNFLNDSEEINKVNYDICVIDEAHCVKSREGKMNRLIAATCRGKRTILLTGTPIMSRPDDIWGIVNLATPNFFGPYEEFKERYIVTEFGIFGEQIIGARDLDELQDKLSLFLIMRSAEDAAIDLPKQLPAKHVSCPRDHVQIKMQAIVEDRKKKQDDKKQQILDSCPVSSGGQRLVSAEKRAAIEKLNDLGKMYIATLQFIADDPAVFRFMNPERGMNKQLRTMLPASYDMSAKTEAIIDAVAELVDADEKVIIFCHFASAAKMLKYHFDKIPGANTVMYTGAESDDVREANINSFKNDPECRVIIGTEAMAEGLNLQVSRFVFHYEQADTYAQREQRNGRIRRIGSRFDTVYVSDYCTVESYDEIKIAKLRRDYRISEMMLSRA